MNNDAKERLQVLLSVGFKFSMNYTRFERTDNCKLVRNLTCHGDILKLLMKVYDKPGNTGKYEKIAQIFNSFDRKKMDNIKYVRSMASKINNADVQSYLETDFVEIQSFDIDDVVFELKNAYCWFYPLSDYHECIVFSYCGYPLHLKYSKEMIAFLVNHSNYIPLKKKAYGERSWIEPLSKMQSVFDVGYEAVGYCGIDESFDHFELLITFYRKLMFKIANILGCESWDGDEDDNEEELWTNADLDRLAKNEYGKSALLSFKLSPAIQPSKKKRKQMIRNL